MAKRLNPGTSDTAPVKPNCFIVRFTKTGQTEVCEGIPLENSSPDRAVYCGERFVRVARKNGADYREVDGKLELVSATVEMIDLGDSRHMPVLVCPGEDKACLVKVDERHPGVTFKHKFWTEVHGGTRVLYNREECLYELRHDEKLITFRTDGSVIVLRSISGRVVHEPRTSEEQALVRLERAHDHYTGAFETGKRGDAALHEMIDVLKLAWNVLDETARDGVLGFLLAEVDAGRITWKLRDHVVMAMTHLAAGWVLDFCRRHQTARQAWFARTKANSNVVEFQPTQQTPPKGIDNKKKAGERRARQLATSIAGPKKGPSPSADIRGRRQKHA